METTEGTGEMERTLAGQATTREGVEEMAPKLESKIKTEKSRSSDEEMIYKVGNSS